FKKVIGQDNSESQRSAPLPDTRHPEPIAAPAPPPSYGAQQPAQSAAAARPAAATRNVLSTDVEIKGTVKFTNDLVVDGKIEGEINSDGNLTVGENARIKAEIKTATVVVYGKVHGNLTATDRVELKSSAEVVGDIKAKTLSIEAGAIFVGKSTVGTPANVPAAAAQPSGKAASPEAPKQGTLAGTVS
ncbi:MAG: polymer-forming cytoskeletal protein, partial [Luteolibacter sp.]